MRRSGLLVQWQKVRSLPSAILGIAFLFILHLLCVVVGHFFSWNLREYVIHALVDRFQCKKKQEHCSFGTQRTWDECINEGLTAIPIRLSDMYENESDYQHQLRCDGWQINESNENCELREINESHRLHKMSLTVMPFHFAFSNLRTQTQWIRRIRYGIYASDLHVQNWRRRNNGIENDKRKVNNVWPGSMHASFLRAKPFQRPILISSSKKLPNSTSEHTQTTNEGRKKRIHPNKSKWKRLPSLNILLFVGSRFVFVVCCSLTAACHCSNAQRLHVICIKSSFAYKRNSNE